MMSQELRLQVSLLALRVGVFLVMAMWTIDKFLNVGHAAAVYQKFYYIPKGTAESLMLGLGVIEAVILIGFLIGFKKRLTYGAVLIFHGISTFSSWKQYIAPFEPYHLLFFAAWPMLAACLALYLLRDEDRLLSID